MEEPKREGWSGWVGGHGYLAAQSESGGAPIRPFFQKRLFTGVPSPLLSSPINYSMIRVVEFFFFSPPSPFRVHKPSFLLTWFGPKRLRGCAAGNLVFFVLDSRA